MRSSLGYVLVWVGFILLLLVGLDVALGGVSGISDRHEACVEAGGTMTRDWQCVTKVEGF